MDATTEYQPHLCRSRATRLHPARKHASYGYAAPPARCPPRRLDMVTIPVSNIRQFDTHRLLPAKYSPNFDSVLTRIASGEDLELVFELDNATNARLLTEEKGSPGIS